MGFRDILVPAGLFVVLFLVLGEVESVGLHLGFALCVGYYRETILLGLGL